MTALIALVLLAVAGSASDPNPADFPVSAKVISFAIRSSASGSGSVHCKDTSITGPYDKTVDCNTGVITNVEKIYEIQIDTSQYEARCRNCGNTRKGAQSPGTYPARWVHPGSELEILSPNEKNELKIYRYYVLSVRQVVPMAETKAIEAAPCGNLAAVSISSDPAGADILLDGKFVGSTPSDATLAPGEHLIQIQKRGFKKWERQTKVMGTKVNVVAELEKGE